MNEAELKQLEYDLGYVTGHGEGGWVDTREADRGRAALSRAREGDAEAVKEVREVVEIGRARAREWNETYGYAAQKRRREERGIQID